MLVWLSVLSQHAQLFRCSLPTLFLPACAVIISCLGLHWVNDLPVSYTALAQGSSHKLPPLHSSTASRCL